MAMAFQAGGVRTPLSGCWVVELLSLGAPTSHHYVWTIQKGAEGSRARLRHHLHRRSIAFRLEGVRYHSEYSVLRGDERREWQRHRFQAAHEVWRMRHELHAGAHD